MSVKSKTSPNGKKNGSASKGKKSTGKTSKRRKPPSNAEEAFMLAWEKTYANRNKRFKIWEDR
jgi:hypothetical protein